MLQELRIHNIAIIDDLDLHFFPGLTILTGETGAGKSVIAGALGLLAGMTGTGDQVRLDEEMGFVEGVFALHDSPASKGAIVHMGIRIEQDDVLVLRRELRPAGRDRVLINGLTSSLAVLKRVAALLLNIQSQDMQRQLSQPYFACDLLDRWQGNHAELKALAEARRLFLKIVQALDDLTLESERAREQSDIWKYQLHELRMANLDPEEESLLAEQIHFGRNARRLLEAAGNARSLLDEADPSARTLLGMILGDLGKVSGDSARLQDVVDLVAGAEASLGEASRLLERYLDTCEIDPAQLDELEQRKALYEDLKRKYDRDCPGLLQLLDVLGQRLDKREHAAENLAGLTAEMEEARTELEKLALALREKRRLGAPLLAEKLENLLRPLGMHDIRIRLAVIPGCDEKGPLVLEDEACGVTDRGSESVELLVRTNAGEGFGPAHRIASGGERSRIFLGISVLDSGQAEQPLRLFDEIDAGLGMEGAVPVADLLTTLSDRSQVLCITHLATVAAKGSHHLKVAKAVVGPRTVTSSAYLVGEQRICELSRLLGGKDALDDSGHQEAFARKLFEQGGSRRTGE